MIEHFYDLMGQIIASPLKSTLMILTVILLEVILSVDNAAVLALMVKHLPENKQKKALSYGIIGAYVFRGLALLFVSFVIQLWWLKVIGGAYLFYMSYKHLTSKNEEQTEDELPKVGWLDSMTKTFWGTVIAVEIMDIVFSIDNIFAVVSMSDNLALIVFGVFIGILAMRFVAGYFIKLMEKYPVLEKCAFVVIGILGIKLMLSIVTHFVPSMTWLDSEGFDMGVSAVTLLVFIVPVLVQKYSKK